MKKLLIFAFALLTTQVMTATERTQAELQKAALSILQQSAVNSKKQATSTESLSVLQHNEQLTVMGNESLGFAVLANDDAWPAVIGYSESSFNAEHNTSLKWFIDEATKVMGEGRKYAPVVPSGDYKSAVAPLCKTLWNQETPYNNQCPTLSGSTPYPTGCVATALSQIMYYWKYPVHGTGSATLSVTNDGEGAIISVNFGEATYEWENMLLDYESKSYTEAQANAVSTLMLHCGVAVGMNYSPSGSGAYSYEARNGMINYFNYNPGINLLTRKYYTTAEWMKIIYTELNAGRPVYYTGVDNNYGGHAFVCDGYNASGYMHINWGWGPSGGNGYFDIALLNPNNYQFSESQNMLIGVAPTQVMNYASHIYGESAFSVTRINKNLMKVDGGAMYNFTGEPFTGKVAVLMDMGDSLKVLQSINVSNIANYYTVGSLSGMIKPQTSSLADGTYRIFVASKSEKEQYWQLVRRTEGLANSYLMVVSNGDYTLTTTTDDSWATGISSLEMKSGSTHAFTTKANRGVYTIDGRYAGTSTMGLGKGLYIVNGKKVVK